MTTLLINIYIRYYIENHAMQHTIAPFLTSNSSPLPRWRFVMRNYLHPLSYISSNYALHIINKGYIAAYIMPSTILYILPPLTYLSYTVSHTLSPFCPRRFRSPQSVPLPLCWRTPHGLKSPFVSGPAAGIEY